MALSAEQQKLLDELTALAAQPDADDFEVEIFSGDKGARIPASKAASWLEKEFGIVMNPAAAASAAAGEGQGDGKGEDPVSKAGRKIFGVPRGA